jgi:hypothetical protein
MLIIHLLCPRPSNGHVARSSGRVKSLVKCPSDHELAIMKELGFNAIRAVVAELATHSSIATAKFEQELARAWLAKWRRWAIGDIDEFISRHSPNMRLVGDGTGHVKVVCTQSSPRPTDTPLSGQWIRLG